MEQEFNINDYIYATLKNFKNVYYGWYKEDLNETHITFYTIQEKEDNYFDDENTAETYYIQFDIWSKEADESLKIKNNLKKILKRNNFSFIEANDNFETDTELYHKALRFEFIKDY